MKKRNILIVEDDDCTATLLKLVLRNQGYGISGITVTGEEAVDMALQKNPDLVLMDIKLRGKIDGIEAYELISASVEIPVVFVSAYVDEEKVALALRTKRSGYVSKPFSNVRLIRAVEKALAGDNRT
jgi:two-component system, LytTR family, response regulator LytT